MRHRLYGHVAYAGLIRIVGAPALEGGSRHGYAAFHTNGNGHIQYPAGLYKFPGSGNRVVVYYACGAEPLRAGGVYRGGGGVGGKGIKGVYMVVYIPRLHRREYALFGYAAEVIQPFLLCGRVKLA